jgi:hypothetical protein
MKVDTNQEYYRGRIAHLRQAASAAIELVDIVTAERDALSAQVELLRGKSKALIEQAERVLYYDIENYLALKGFAYALDNALDATPAACLAQVRAEAVSEFSEFLFVKKGLNIKDVANQYAESIRQEVK